MTTLIQANDWMQTYTGRAFWPKAPAAETVNIVDIAHALANICRFGGHTTEFYSVAQHSVLVADIMAGFDNHKPSVLAGLMHDAAEAYVGDMIRPLKHDGSVMGEQFCLMEEQVMEAIRRRFSMLWSEKLQEDITWADNTALATEARDVMSTPPRPWHPMPAPMPETIIPLTPFKAEELFLVRFMELKS